VTTIILTGASGGLGVYLASRLRSDYSIVGGYNTRLPDDPGLFPAGCYQVDVSDAASVAAFAERLAGIEERLVLVNLAGVSIDGMAHKLSEDAWDTVLDTNLRGAWLMSRALLPAMREQGWGRIVNISSVVGQIGVAGTGAYSASKAGLFGLTRALAAENAAKGVTVNALALGYFNAGMGSALDASTVEAVCSRIPMRRFGDPANVAAAIRFCIAADYMTGSVIDINGGLP
jgi:NAD(P)-dependent dehydrogenase (short-subunit alcohol dehydrogenase family)